MLRIPIVVFAQVPPPEHGQSRMVQRTLDALRTEADDFDVHHVNARFSEKLEDIGESSLGKLALSFKYLVHAVRLRIRIQYPILVYVPGPANWSPVLRDWMLLSVLRLLYRRVVFHWHAIGQGEWAHGSPRLTLDGPKWLDRLARAVSRRMLEKPFASISVSESSRKDASAIGSARCLVVPNGNEDPCPDFGTAVKPLRDGALAALRKAERPVFRILFLSHGTLEKGMLDAVEALRILLESGDTKWRFEVTFAGGVSESIQIRFDRDIHELQRLGGGRLNVNLLGYVSGDEKRRCYLEHDIFLSPSRWESFGLTVLEAMAYGMRIVAAASDGVRGVLPPDYPYLTPVASPEDLGSALRACCAEMLESPDSGIEGTLRQRFLDHFQLKDFSSHLIAAFRELGEITCSSAVSASVAASSSSDLRPSTFRPSDSSSSKEDDKSVVAPYQDPTPIGVHSRSFAVESSSDSSLLSPICISVYLADQNPGHDRSYGISRMTQVILEALEDTGKVHLEAVVSKTSQHAPESVRQVHLLPWGTRGKTVRLFTDHLHPLFHNGGKAPDVYYFPKGYLPLLHRFCRPSVVTIHDTIIQYDEDHYPDWRRRREYAYWARMLKHTLRHADQVLTVSENSKWQIQAFMDRHGIPRNDITVSYEPCIYERLPQPENPPKTHHVIHLASREPHKRTAHLVRWWHEAENLGRDLPALHLIGTVPPEVEDLLTSSRTIVKRPFLDDSALQAAYRQAKALILPSEIEGFGLPALEAYYLGTPVCYVRGTSVEEVLAVATDKGGFTLNEMETLFLALDEVMQMSPGEVRSCGLKLREIYAAERVVKRMLSVFSEVKN